MNKVITKKFKKANIHANSDFDFYQLERRSEHLLDCKIKKDINDVTFTFTCQFEQVFDTIQDMSLSYKYQVLFNVQYMLEDSKRVQISLDPKNLVIDTNMMPKAIMRDTYETAFDEKDFIHQYKALIGCVLQNKYTFSDYYQGGNNLLKKNKNTSVFFDVESIDDLIETLHKELQAMQERMKHSIIEVDKGKYKKEKITSRVVLLLLIVAIAVGGYFGGFRFTEEKTINKANEAFIANDYITVIKTLSGIGANRMNKNTKYILAVSNVKAEALTDEQKNNILASITLNSDERVLDFWIYLGESSFDKAIDIAKQLGNEEYLAYAYMKEKVQVTNDRSLTGAQREDKLKRIDGSLKDLNIGSGDKSKNEEDTAK